MDKTTVRLDHVAYGQPVAIKDANGEWVEVGYITDLNFSVLHDHQWVDMAETPIRISRRYELELDVRANDAAHRLVLDMIRRERELG